ncbi:MAG: Fur family transcriptional regulator [Rhodospirillales bacterium]
MPPPSRIERLCIEKNMKMTEQRRVIARVLSTSTDHPDVEQVYRRAAQMNSHISIATVYRTVRLFEEANILERHDFGNGRSRYEEITDEHHDHLIDIQSGKVIEFQNQEIEALQEKIAARYGFKLIGHRLELYGVPAESKKKRARRRSGGKGSRGSA